jgi:hypothetical protein
VNHEDIENRFVYHPPTGSKVGQHEQTRAWCRELAHRLNGLLPEGREKSLAVTHLEEVMYWANGAIARSPTQP